MELLYATTSLLIGLIPIVLQELYLQPMLWVLLVPIKAADIVIARTLKTANAPMNALAKLILLWQLDGTASLLTSMSGKLCLQHVFWTETSEPETDMSAILLAIA